jgi:hypothetical protein
MSPLRSLRAILRARLNHTHGRLVNPLSHLVKLR